MWKRTACLALTCALASMVYHDPAVRLRIVHLIRNRHGDPVFRARKAEYPKGWSALTRNLMVTNLMLLAGNKPRIKV